MYRKDKQDMPTSRSVIPSFDTSLNAELLEEEVKIGAKKGKSKIV